MKNVELYKEYHKIVPDYGAGSIMLVHIDQLVGLMRTYGNWDDYRIYNEEQHTNWLWQNWHE